MPVSVDYGSRVYQKKVVMTSVGTVALPLVFMVYHSYLRAIAEGGV
jgi:hypothetical protein